MRKKIAGHFSFLLIMLFYSLNFAENYDALFAVIKNKNMDNIYAIGDTINLKDGFSFVLTSMSFSRGDEIFSPKDGEIYVIAEMYLANGSKSDYSFSSLAQTCILDIDGYKRSNPGLFYTGTRLSGGIIPAGSRVEGQISYSIPDKSSIPLRLRFYYGRGDNQFVDIFMVSKALLYADAAIAFDKKTEKDLSLAPKAMYWAFYQTMVAETITDDEKAIEGNENLDQRCKKIMAISLGIMAANLRHPDLFFPATVVAVELYAANPTPNYEKIKDYFMNVSIKTLSDAPEKDFDIHEIQGWVDVSTYCGLHDWALSRIGILKEKHSEDAKILNQIETAILKVKSNQAGKIRKL